MVLLFLCSFLIAQSQEIYENFIDDLESTSSIPSVTLTNEEDVRPKQTYFVVQVTLGSKKVKLNLVVDTGSNVRIKQATWVIGPNCTDCFKPDTIYDPKKSTTSNQIFPSSTVRYEDGSFVTGPAYTDTFTVAGLSVTATFICGSSTSFHWNGFAADGVLGLAYQPVGKGPLPFITALKAQGKIPNALFSLYYSDNIFKGRMKPTMTLGLPEDSKYANSTLQNYSVTVNNVYTASGLWQFTANNIEIGDSIVSSQPLVVVDSAQEAIFVPQLDYSIVAQVLTNSGFSKTGWMYSRSCNSSAGFPTIYIGCTDSQYLVIPSYRYLVMNGTGSLRTCSAYLFQSSDNNWYIGDSLFRTYYSVFSIDNSTITFTPAKWLPEIHHKSSSSDDDDDELSGGAIAGIVISCIAGVIIIGVIIYCVIKKRRNSGYDSSMGKPLQEVSLHA